MSDINPEKECVVESQLVADLRQQVQRLTEALGKKHNENVKIKSEYQALKKNNEGLQRVIDDLSDRLTTAEERLETSEKLIRKASESKQDEAADVTMVDNNNANAARNGMGNVGPKPELCERWDAKQLMQQFPPQFTSNNKRAVLHRFLPNRHSDCNGFVTIARYTIDALLPLFPNKLSGITDFTKNRIAVSADIYDYKSMNANASSDIYEFWVNFADANLFGFYSGDLFAQDEVMTLEHPILCAIREKLISLFSDKSNLDCERYRPTCDNGAVVILNAQRHGSFGKEKLSAVYGNRFAYAHPSVINKSCERNDPPTVSNIIAIACRTMDLSDDDKSYKTYEIKDILYTAFTGFKAAKIEATKHFQNNGGIGEPKIYIHTGNWGCGAFGGDVEFHSLLQTIAASAAGVDKMFYHSFDRQSQQKVGNAMETIKANGFEGCQSQSIIEHCSFLGYKWGIPNGT